MLLADLVDANAELRRGGKPSMLRIIAALLLWAVAAASAAAQSAPSPCSGGLVYFGSTAQAPEQGVYGARFDARTGRLCPLGRSATVNQATWMTPHPTMPVLYATSQAAGVSDPSVFAYRVDAATGALSPINAAASAGAGPTHISVDGPSSTLFAAHWNSGHVSAMPVRADGGLEPATSVQAGEASTRTSRAHAVELDPSRRFAVAAEFGLDRLRLFRFDPRTRRLTPSQAVSLPEGSGPRHFVFHRNGKLFYLLNEITSEVRVYRWDAAAGALQLEQAVPTLPPGFQGSNKSAGIVITPDARHLYVSNRGEDAIVAYAVDPASGRLSEVQRIGSGGKVPRDFALDPTGRWMLVANQDSDTVAVFARDPATGKLTSTGQGMATPRPVVVTFIGR
jgi:6-phosphogluconolactonase